MESTKNSLEFMTFMLVRTSREICSGLGQGREASHSMGGMPTAGMGPDEPVGAWRLTCSRVREEGRRGEGPAAGERQGLQRLGGTISMCRVRVEDCMGGGS